MSLGKKALLVSLNIGLPTLFKKDKQETRAVKSRHGIHSQGGHDVARVTKDLYPEVATRPIVNFRSEADAYYRRNTVAWPENGWQLLPAILFSEYAQAMRQFAARFEIIKQNWDASLDSWLAEHRSNINGLFNPTDYEAKPRILDRFTFDWRRRPVPDSGSFYVDVGEADLRDMKADADKFVADALVEGHRQVWQRLVQPLQRIVENCTKDKVKIYDSLLGNLREIVAIIPALNLTNDPALDAFRQLAEAEFRSFTTDQLRDDDKVKAAAARKANEILQKMQGFY